jgi:hypothetical protein
LSCERSTQVILALCYREKRKRIRMTDQLQAELDLLDKEMENVKASRN